MAITYPYPCKVLADAVSGALLEEGPFQRRLVRGLSGSVRLLYSSHRGLMPAELQKKFDALWEACNRESDSTEMLRPLEATAKKMSDAEARKWLDELFTLYVRVAEDLN